MASNNKTALIAGASGLIGSRLLPMLLESAQYQKVIALSRKPLEVKHARLENVVVDFDNLESYASSLKADDIFCCLGTTIRKAKTRDNFRKVDFQYPLELAKLTLVQGAKQYLLVSALGANKNSSIFYNRVKGEIEDAISFLNFGMVHLFRPSLLLGPRNEDRSAESAAKIFYWIFNFLIPKRYKAIDSKKVARAMLVFAEKEERGIFFHESVELQAY